MAAFTGPERASCVFWFEESKSATTVQRNFRTKYAKDPPSRPTIYEWHKCFVETGSSVKNKKSSGRSSTFDEVVEQDVAARGLDLPCVDWIVQYNAPFSVSDYVHRVGRTARVGSSGSALLFLTPSEIEFVSRLEDRRIRLKEEKMDQCLKRLLDNNPHQRGGPHTPEEAATALQLRFENAVLERQELHDLGCKAYMSWVRFYASYPKATRDVFNFKELHLGHFAKSFALRDPPRWIGDFGKWKGHSDQKRQRKNQRDGDYGTSGTHSGKINKKRKVFSEFDSGLEPVKKKSKPL